MNRERMQARNLQAVRRYQALHPEQTRMIKQAFGANRKARRAGSPDRLTWQDVRAVLHDEAQCAYCESREALTIDHVVPFGKGGLNTRANLQACCFSCNASKGTSDRPRRWSQRSEACLECSEDSKRHLARGLCVTCYMRTYRKERNAAS